MRQQRSLAGNWRFQLDPEGNLQLDQVRGEREIAVPLPWQAALPELERYSGYGWYQREFELDASWLNGEVLLRFGAVDYRAEVYINGQVVGEHEGGYTAFEFPVRKYVREGANTLTVRVYDAAQQGVLIPRWRDQQLSQVGGAAGEVPAEDMPHGKQTWYIDASGIWQDVTLTAVPAGYITHVQASGNVHGVAKITVEVNRTIAGEMLVVEVDGLTASSAVKNDTNVYTFVLTVPDAKLWTTDAPNLYTAIVKLGDADEVRVRFGFREISTKDGKLLLNGEPIYLISALDQDFYPETIYTVPSEAYLRDEFEKAKALGMNSLRCHIKPPEPIYYDLADEMGLLIWAEIPSWRTFQPKTGIYPPVLDDGLKARLKQTLEEMIRRDFNHPSLIIWTIVNEDWGTLIPLRAEDRAWLSEMYDLCKRLDPTRLAVDNSACAAPWGTSYHVKTDLNDYHWYNNIPEKTYVWSAVIEEFSMRPAWLFSQYGDAEPRNDEPLILSEFGNWGMPKLAEMTRGGEPGTLREPSWFSLGPWWSGWDGEPGFPEGVLERFKKLGFDQIWGDYDTFAEATQRHQFAAMKYEIETMRRFPSIAGYVITELTDTYWESNGLMDFYRQPKVYHNEFHHFNAEDVIVPELKRWAYWDTETVWATLHVSHYSGADWNGAQFNAEMGSGNAANGQISSLARGETRKLGEFYWRATSVSEPTNQTLKATVTDAGGTLLAQAESPVLVLPVATRQAAYTEPIYFVDSRSTGDMSSSTFGESLQRLGYQVYEGDARLTICDKVDRDILEWVAQGNDMLLLSEGRSPFFWQHPRGGAYSGDWMGSFSWLRPNVYRRLQRVQNPVSLPFTGIVPETVLLGLPLNHPAYHQDILAGQITAWLGHPAAHTVQFRYGKGRVIVTTYALRDALTTHPLAAAMLHDLVDYLASDACAPTLEVGVL